jgi:hypothetical protein
VEKRDGRHSQTPRYIFITSLNFQIPIIKNHRYLPDK